MTLHVRGSISIRFLPCDDALVHVVGSDSPIRWLDQAQPRNRRSPVRSGNRSESRELGGSSTHIGERRKIRIGGWLGGSRIGVEAIGFYLGQENARQTIGGGSALVLARPFFDPTSRRENARVVAAPGAFSGSVVIDSSAQMWGFEVNPFWRVMNGERVSMDVITGLRYLQYQEALKKADLAPEPARCSRSTMP